MDLTVAEAVPVPLRSQTCVSSAGCEAAEKSCPYKLILEGIWERFSQRYLLHSGMRAEPGIEVVIAVQGLRLTEEQ